MEDDQKAKIENIEVTAEVVKVDKSKTFKVIKPFTLDKFYKKNATFVSSNSKVIEKLLNEKYIK